MEKESKYEIEIKNFRKNFSEIKDKRIVIYGMGRRSATLLPGIKDYNVVGILDRDACNIGKELCGVKVISLNHIEKVADLIIINSDPSNYEIIYGRIEKDVVLPVYYADGRLAKREKRDNGYQLHPYWKDGSYEILKQKIDRADVVSFDLFDTLVMRKIFSPEDVFRLLGEMAKGKLGIGEDIAQLRATIAAKCGSCATLDEIYIKIKKEMSLSEDTLEILKKTEKDIDIGLCEARRDIAKLYEYSKNSGKEVYLISDMYYSTTDISHILKHCGISDLDETHIWVSSEKKCDKISGEMWLEYAKQMDSEKKYLHIGDNAEGDIQNPKKHGIDTYYVMSAKEMLKNSSAAVLASSINTVSDSLCLGLVIEKVFNSPFALSDTKGRVSFEKEDIYGYCVYGPLLEKFLLWLYGNSRRDCIEKLLFFARDGYFLVKDYDKVSKLLDDGYQQIYEYLPISRRLIYLATIENEEDLKRVLFFPYVGTFAEYMKARFEIEADERTKEYNDTMVNVDGGGEQLLKWIQPYRDLITEEIKKERTNYMAYLTKNQDTCPNTAYGIVDLGYYGTNQYYYQKLTGLKTQGYCFFSYLAEDNMYMKEISMKGCFQYGNDLTAENSLVKKKIMFIETFLTAPYGMIRYIDEYGNMVCETDKKNQDHFQIKESIHAAAMQFVTDYLNIYQEVLKEKKSDSVEDGTETMEDILFYQMLDGCADVSKDILKGFYFDNDFVGGRDVPIEM